MNIILSFGTEYMNKDPLVFFCFPRVSMPTTLMLYPDGFVFLYVRALNVIITYKIFSFFFL